MNCPHIADRYSCRCCWSGVPGYRRRSWGTASAGWRPPCCGHGRTWPAGACRGPWLLEAIIARAPQAPWPQVILTHVLLQEGRDSDAAEQVLREVLCLDPGHAEARRKLEVLLRQQGGLAS